MKPKLIPLFLLLLLTARLAFGQDDAGGGTAGAGTGGARGGGGGGAAGAGGGGGARRGTTTPTQAALNSSLNSRTRFNLDFPGGTPRDFVAAVRTASGETFNFVVSQQADQYRLPPIKVENVTSAELVGAIASFKDVHITIIGNNTTAFDLNLEPAVSRFYNLAPYLDTYSVDDIITALNTAVGLMGEQAPKITFHKETKLLIAMGTKTQLGLIDQELEALDVSLALKKPAPVEARPATKT